MDAARTTVAQPSMLRGGIWAITFVLPTMSHQTRRVVAGLPIISSYTAFAAITSIGVVGLYISYLVPIVLRLTTGRAAFHQGPFNLGPFSVPVALLAVAWLLFAIFLFIIPSVCSSGAASCEDLVSSIA